VIQERHFAHPVLPSTLQAETALAFLQDRLQKTAIGLKGDSLSLSGMPPPTEIIRKVQWWLEGRFNSPFENLGDVW